MRRLSFIVMLCVVQSLYMTKCLAVSTPEVVTKFYDAIRGLSQASNDSEAARYTSAIKDCFLGKDDGGIPVPNDFYSWEARETNITSNVYSFRARDMFYTKKKLKVPEYHIESSKYISEVELEKYKNATSDLIQTIVRKTFSDGEISKTFSDTLIIEYGKIGVFNNTISDEDVNALRALAARYYSSKLYYLAYKTYERIISVDPKNANAYYRLALLTYWRRGCNFSVKTAHKKGLEYAEKSKSLGFYKAETAIYYMKTTRI